MFKNLVICRAGYQSLHRLWNTPGKNFDTVLLCSDAAAFDSFGSDNANSVLIKGKKFPAIKEYLAETGIGHDFYCFIDGGIAMTAGQLNNCFEFMAASGIKVMHPAISNSGANSIMQPNPDTEYRFANTIDTMCLFSSAEFLQQVVAEFDSCQSESSLPGIISEKTGIPYCIYDMEPAVQFHRESSTPNPGIGINTGITCENRGEVNAENEFNGRILSFKLRNIISFPIIYSKEKSRYLPDLLESLPPGSEIILMETIKSGDREGIFEIEKNGNHIIAKYYYNEWDYSKARNACKSLASRPVIFSIDSDERLAAFQHTAILKAALDLYKSGFAGLKVRNISTASVNSAPGNYSCTVTEQVRVFKNIPQLQWRAKCHENIEMSMYDCGMAYADSNILIHHAGYDIRPEALRDKHLDRLRMLINDNDYRNHEGYFDYIVKESVNYNYYKQLTKEAQ